MSSPPVLPADNGSLRAGYRSDIQGLRGVAILGVVAYHAALPVSGGFAGVDIFFVISGFVITSMLKREWQHKSSVSLKKFYVNRFRRLAPALSLMLTIGLLISVLVLPPFGSQQDAAATALGAILLVANVVIANTTGGYFDSAAELNPFLNTWSLSVEEQFYLIFPLMILAGWWLSRSRERGQQLATRIVAMATVSSFVLMLLSAQVGSLPFEGIFGGFYGLGVRAWEFGVGALLVLVRIRVLPTRTKSATGVAGLLFLGASFFVLSKETLYPSLWTLLPVCGTVLLILSGADARGPAAQLLSSRVLTSVGSISYSWYLWHWPALVFAGFLFGSTSHSFLLAATVSLLPAVLSYMWVEKPIRYSNHYTGRRLTLLVVICTAVPAAIAICVLVGAKSLWGLQGSPQLAEITSSGPVRSWECMTANTNSDGVIKLPDQCVTNADATGRPIYLVGDSTASHFREGINLAAIQMNRPVVEITSGGCVYWDAYISYPPHRDECRAYFEGTKAFLQSSEAGTVIVAQSGALWDEGNGLVVGLDENSYEQQRRNDVMELGLTTAAIQLQSQGHTVLLIDPMYRLGFDRNKSCNLLQLLGDGCLQAQVPVSALSDSQGEAKNTIERVSASTGVSRLDLAQYQCPDGLCPMTDSDGLIYVSDTHVSIPFSQSLAPVFQQALEKLGTSRI